VFSSLVSALEDNRLPDSAELRHRLRAALAKKEGMLKLPYLFRPSDPKINPDIFHMLWAALIVEDIPAQEKIIALLAWELSDAVAGEGGALDAENLDNALTDSVNTLLSLPPDPAIRHTLRGRVLRSPLLREHGLLVSDL